MFSNGTSQQCYEYLADKGEMSSKSKRYSGYTEIDLVFKFTSFNYSV